MISFLICLALLIGGYFLYGKVVENTFDPDDRETPAVKINDGVDYVVLPQWKLFMIQLLNIAGLGPIFGALQGALWGPIVFLWITFGTIFAGGVHDYFSGMMSERNNGASISEISGIYLGGFMKNVMRVFSVVLLIMVGTVFAVGPAGLIVTLFKNGGSNGIVTTTLFWLIIVLVYYFIATFMSIDKIIGKIYPLFGICLIVMAVGVIIGIFVKPEYTIPELWTNFRSMHPKGTPVWSFMFITVACGAISGFHSTQSPLMARCMKSEKQGHFVFYGAMVSEGIIALVWAAAEIFLTFGTGMGAGLILNGQLYRGACGNAGEIGHVRMAPEGPIGYGKAGSFEGFVSGAGIARLARALAEERLQTGAGTAYCRTREELPLITAERVATAAKAGDPTALAVYRTCGEMLGAGLALLVDVLNPEVIVIGSIYTRAGELLREGMERVLQREALPDSLRAVKILPAALGEQLGDVAAVTAGETF